MASLLDYDFDLDKMLGTTVNPVQGLVNDPNFQTEKNIASGLGVADALISGYGKQYAPEILLRGLINAKSGRQGVIDKQVKGYMTQQDMFTQTLKNRKLNQDIILNKYGIEEAPYNLITKRFEAESAPYKAGEARNTYHKSSLFLQGIRDEVQKLEKAGKTDEVNFIRAAPKEYFKKLSERDYRTQKMPDGYNVAAKSIGLDPNNRAKWSQQDWSDLDSLIKAADSVEAQDKNLATQEANRKNPRFINNVRIPNRNEVKNAIINRKKREKKLGSNNIDNDISIADKNINVSDQKNAQELTNQNIFDSTNLEFYVPSTKELQTGMIKKGTNKKFPEGAVFTPTGVNYTEDGWNNLGSAYKFALRPTRSPDNATEIELATEGNAEAIGMQNEYLFSNIDRRQKAIAEILSKPKFIKDLTSLGGRAVTNLNLGSYGFTSDVQDIQNLFDKVKNQTFITEIQAMRANNKTGGAVGNVSDKEVAMFQNIPAALMRGGSAKFLYNEINNVYEQQKDLMRNAQKRYTGLYGQTKNDEFGLSNYNADNYKKFLPYDEALKEAGVESFKVKQNKRIMEGVEAEKKKNIDRILKR